MEDKIKEELAKKFVNAQSENPVMKWITHILLALVIALLIGAFNKMGDMSDRLIRIEERSITNSSTIGTIQNSVNHIQVQQGDMQDRMTRMEVRQEDKGK